MHRPPPFAVAGAPRCPGRRLRSSAASGASPSIVTARNPWAGRSSARSGAPARRGQTAESRGMPRKIGPGHVQHRPIFPDPATFPGQRRYQGLAHPAPPGHWALHGSWTAPAVTELGLTAHRLLILGTGSSGLFAATRAALPTPLGAEGQRAGGCPTSAHESHLTPSLIRPRPDRSTPVARGTRRRLPAAARLPAASERVLAAAAGPDAAARRPSRQVRKPRVRGSCPRCVANTRHVHARKCSARPDRAALGRALRP